MNEVPPNQLRRDSAPYFGSLKHVIHAPESLLAALGRMFPDSSRTTLRQLLRSGRVRVNTEGEMDAKREVRPGDQIEIASRAVQQNLSPKLSLLYEDEHLLVIVKAAGLLSVATPKERQDTAQAHLNDYLRSKGEERVHVVHRLDRDCSGVMLFAKSFEVRQLLKERFEEHDIERQYVAIIEGAMPDRTGTIRSYLAEEPDYKVRSTPSLMKGKLAVTHYKTISSGERHSVLEVTLETGRKNQIRVHLSESGHPIVGDKAYGSGANPIGRLGLHARLLGFVHPVSGQKMRFEAPLPAAFRTVTG